MNQKLHIVQSLYGEAGDREETERLLRDDPALREEYRALGEARLLLDRRRRPRPDPLVLETIFAAAAAGVGPRTVDRRVDRRPVPSRAVRFRAFGLVTAVIAVLMLTSTGLWQAFRTDHGPTAGRERPVADAQPAPSAAPERRVEPAEQTAPSIAASPAPVLAERRSEVARKATPEPVATQAAEPVAAAAQVAPAALAGGEEVLGWDASDEVLELHKRVELLKAGVGESWDEPAVPLEMLPAARSGASGSRFHQTGDQQQPGSGPY